MTTTEGRIHYSGLRALGLMALAGGIWVGTACHVRQADPVTEPVVTGPAAVASGSVERHIALGDAFYQRGRPAEALREWKVALALDPSRRDVAERIRSAEDSSPERFQEPPARSAVTATESADDVDERIRSDVEEAARAYADSRLKDAERLWRHVLELIPNQAAAADGLARLERERYRDQADRPFDRMTRELYVEGMRAYRRREWVRAELKLAEAAKLNPDQPQVKTYLDLARSERERQDRQELARSARTGAREAEHAGRWADARKQWQSLNGVEPGAPEAREGLARCDRALQDWAGEQGKRADAAEHRGEWNEALRFVQEVLAVLPEQPAHRARRDRLLAAMRSRNAGATAEQEARRLQAESVEARNQGDYPRAQRALEQAVALRPQDRDLHKALEQVRQEMDARQAERRRRADVRYSDGLAAYQRGELDEALTAWRETLELNPEHEKAKANIRKIEQELR